jgi:CHAD domain-containing protein
LKTKDYSEYLCGYYRQKADSFITNLYLAGIDCNTKNIHNVRVDVKSIRVFFRLIDAVGDKSFSISDYKNIFNVIYKSSGNIRETQMNLSLIKSFDISSEENYRYAMHISENELIYISGFRDNMNTFDIPRFAQISKKVKKIIKQTSGADIEMKCRNFVLKAADKILKLSDVSSEENLHKIRKYFKIILYTSLHLDKMNSGGKIKKIIVSAKKTEVKLGSWHDKIVFCNSINNFLLLNGGNDVVSLPELKQISLITADENRKLLLLLFDETKSLVNKIKNFLND